MFQFALVCGAAQVFTAAIGPNASIQAAPDTAFVQEYREEYVLGATPAENDVRAVAIDAAGRVWAAAKAGIRVLADGKWTAPMKPEDIGPTFCAATDNKGSVWIGSWNGLYCGGQDGNVERIPEVAAPIGAVCALPQGIVAMGPEGMWRNTDGAWRHLTGKWPSSPRAIAPEADGTIWVSTAHGLFHLRDVEVLGEYHSEDEIATGELRGAATAPDGSVWVGGLGGIDVYRNGKRVASHTTSNGLPSADVRGLAFHPNGTLWAATGIGAARFDGKRWSLRHSLRWIPSDDVRNVASDPRGTAWIATGKGISAIKQRSMTLAEKAGHFLKIVYERHVREPGLVEKCLLEAPGDVTKWRPMDEDNDGQYTGMYLAMESFRYAVTRDPEARENAKKAFGALEFLQKVTGTPGFFARTVIPSAWAKMSDPNTTYTPQDYAETHIQDPRWKKVEQRWRPSADGKWLWKGDTSSDEVTGHFYGYVYYYDLAADEAERERVRAHVRRIMDHILDGDFALRDIDGAPTRWAVWTPEVINENPNWRAERPTNSIEILSFLKTTYHMTNDEKYEKAYRHLIEDHGYAETARRPKPTALSERTHIDSELLAMVFPSLLQYEKDPKLLEKYREGLSFWLGIVRDDESPFYGFICGAFGEKDFKPDACVEFLRDAPLDLVEWTVDNSLREDVRLARAPEPEPMQTDRMLPASERGVIRWDKNPWAALQGSNGRVESSGVYWLLPYWMGRYYGFIQAPK